MFFVLWKKVNKIVTLDVINRQIYQFFSSTGSIINITQNFIDILHIYESVLGILFIFPIFYRHIVLYMGRIQEYPTSLDNCLLLILLLRRNTSRYRPYQSNCNCIHHVHVLQHCLHLMNLKEENEKINDSNIFTTCYVSLH